MFLATEFWPTTLSFPLILFAGSSGRAGLYMMLGLLLVLAPFWYLAIRSGRRERRIWIRRGEVFDEGSGTKRGGRWIGHFHGREAALFSAGGGKGRLPEFNLQVACSSPVLLAILPRALIEIGKIRNSFETGDAAVDREFNFISDAPDRFNAWFGNPENRQMLLALLHQGSHKSQVDLRKGRLSWRIRGHGATEPMDLPPQMPGASSGSAAIDEAKLGDLERDRTREILEALNHLAGAIESGF